MNNWIEPQKITFIEKLRLIFRPLKKIKEITSDYIVIMYYKEMDGKIYVIREEIIDDGQTK